MWHPLEAIPAGFARWIAFIVLMALSAWLARKSNGSLKTYAAPKGLCSFESAGDEAGARPILDSWTDKGVYSQALDSLWIRAFFLVVYTTGLALAVLMAADVLYDWLSLLYLLGVLVAWAQWGAAILGIVGNVCLAMILYDAPVDPWADTARWCAVRRTTLVVVGWAFVALGVIAWLAC